MRTVLALAAGGIVILANTVLLISVSRNRADTPGGSVELTERELLLRPVGGESTALFLEVDWDTLARAPKGRGAASWLDAAKLEELGFDCSVPVTQPDAEPFYRSLLARQVYVVLEYEGDSWKQASAERRRQTRLFAIDAGQDPGQLRVKYTDRARHLIAKALVGLSFERGDTPSFPRLQGRIERLLPRQVFVPRPHNQVFRGLTPRDRSRGNEAQAEPRFAVTLSWGSNHEPWVVGARRWEGQGDAAQP